MKYIIIAVSFLFIYTHLSGQNIPLPSDLPEGHPRLMTFDKYKPILQTQIKEEVWAKEIIQVLEKQGNSSIYQWRSLFACGWRIACTNCSLRKHTRC